MPIDGKYGLVTTESGNFHYGEPVFILRAADLLAPGKILQYAADCDEAGCDPKYVEAVKDWARVMLRWQDANPTKVKRLD